MSDPDALRVSLASHPSPVLRYEVRDGVPTVTATNDAFDAAIGVAAGAAVTAVFERFETVESSGTDPPATQLRAGEPVELRLGSNDDAAQNDGAVQYDAQVLSPDTDGGTIVFTESDAATPPTGGVDGTRVATAISHDLRNPLDVAGAHLEAARETGSSEHFDAVAAAHDRMDRIIQDVLTLARGEAALDPEPGVAVDAPAERAWRTVDTGAWRLDLGASLPTTRADADRLQRLFENLFRNAVEHGPDGGTVRVGTLAQTAGVFVADDGPGIPATERDAVFTPGYTVEGGTTGLGLTIVDRIATAHGWTVTITESERGGGRIEIRFEAGE